MKADKPSPRSSDAELDGILGRVQYIGPEAPPVRDNSCTVGVGLAPKGENVRVCYTRRTRPWGPGGPRESGGRLFISGPSFDLHSAGVDYAHSGFSRGPANCREYPVFGRRWDQTRR